MHIGHQPLLSTYYLHIVQVWVRFGSIICKIKPHGCKSAWDPLLDLLLCWKRFAWPRYFPFIWTCKVSRCNLSRVHHELCGSDHVGGTSSRFWWHRRSLVHASQLKSTPLAAFLVMMKIALSVLALAVTSLVIFDTVQQSNAEIGMYLPLFVYLNYYLIVDNYWGYRLAINCSRPLSHIGLTVCCSCSIIGWCACKNESSARQVEETRRGITRQAEWNPRENSKHSRED